MTEVTAGIGAVSKPISGAGRRGQNAGETALCTVGKSGSGLTYCGYDITDLADNTTFEEVAYLLFNGELPKQAQLSAYQNELTRDNTLFMLIIKYFSINSWYPLICSNVDINVYIHIKIKSIYYKIKMFLLDGIKGLMKV